MDILLEENKSNGNKSPVITDNISNIELDEINSYGNETIKVRKPYTITKQRERWTEEEHTKFVEGLQLYGRGWRRIEEHIGTKTAVQIRSHAQKFFSKMARDASSDQLKIAKAIEIPPPRPKRKPSHPYPRKLGNSLNQRIPFFKQIGLQTLLKTSMSEQGRTSPTSVLLTDGPDDQSPSFLQSLQDNCNSPVKSAGGSPPSPGLANTGDKYIESYRIPCGKMASQEVSAEAATIRLFGKTLPLADAPKPSHPSAASIVPDITPSSLLKAVTQHVSGTTSEHGSSTLTMQGCNYVPLSFNLVGHLPKSYEGGIPLPPYSFVPPGDNSINTSTSHLPWQFFGRTFPSKVMNPQSTNPVSCPPSNCIEALSSHETPKEGSCSGSCTTCHNGITISGHDVDAADSKKADNLKKHEQSPCSLLKLSDTLTFRSRKLGLDEPRTSLRCKRFRAEREAQPIAATEDVESPTFRLCL